MLRYILTHTFRCCKDGWVEESVPATVNCALFGAEQITRLVVWGVMQHGLRFLSKGRAYRAVPAGEGIWEGDHPLG